DLVEGGEVEGDRVEGMLRSALAEPLAAGLDALALGCTHYGFLRPVLAEMLPSEVRVIDAAEAVARRTLAVLRESGFDAEEDGEGRPLLGCATGEAAEFESTIDGLQRAGVDLPTLHIGRPVG